MIKREKCENCIHNEVCEKLEEFRDPLGWVDTNGEFVCNFYENASDVAEEIFAEIEKYLVTGSTFYGQPIHSIGIGTFAELKKKYTEEGK